jgi:hypothetical protein
MGASMALACSTPVFRYAIERWEADPYRLMVFTDGELTESHQEAVRGFEQYQRYGYQMPPLLVEQVEISEATNLSEKVWSKISTNQSAPAVALLYPSIMRNQSVVWAEPLSTNALNRIVMSPARLETASRLLRGDAAVWLLIPGDDLEENQRVRELLEATHRKIESGTVYNDDFLKLVEESGGEAPPLKFSVLEVDRNDPREAVLLAMLTRLSPEATTHTGPIVVPIFGQGRAAVIMMKEFISAEYIERVAEFLTGACSCEVKSLNPGFDVLIPIDWISGITEEYVFDAELPPLTSPSAALEPVDEPIPEVNQPIAELEKSETRLFSGVLGVLLLVALGVLGFVTWLMVRKNHNHDAV